MTLLLTLLPAGPVVLALWAGLAGGRVSARSAGRVAGAASAASLATAVTLLVVTVTGARPTLGPAADPWLRADPLTGVLASLVAVVALTVTVYAGRNLEGSPRADRFFAAAGTVVAGTLVVVAAGRLSVLVVGWLVTSTATVVLVGHRGDPAARAAARRTAAALALGDGCLVAALVVVVATVGDPALERLGPAASRLAAHDLLPRGAPTLTAATAVGLLLVVAALARAGQLPLPSWLPGTVAAPTPVSALLHAGVVNAGGVLLVRCAPVLAAARPADVALAAGALATVVVATGALRLRPDVKGALAVSTSAQMGFMLLACAAGAPAVAVVHLVGHALYKAARFLGAGDGLRAAVDRRRYLAGPGSARRTVVRSAVGAALGLLALAVWIAVRPAGVPVADTWFTGAALLAATTGAGRWWRPTGSAAATGRLVAAAGVATALYLGAVTALHAALDPVLTVRVVPTAAAPALLGLLAALVLAVAVGVRHARVGATVGVLLEAAAPVRTPVVRRRSAPRPVRSLLEVGTPVLRSGW